jgi:hypothetical protein
LYLKNEFADITNDKKISSGIFFVLYNISPFILAHLYTLLIDKLLLFSLLFIYFIIAATYIFLRKKKKINNMVWVLIISFIFLFINSISGHIASSQILKSKENSKSVYVTLLSDNGNYRLLRVFSRGVLLKKGDYISFFQWNDIKKISKKL